MTAAAGMVTGRAHKAGSAWRLVGVAAAVVLAAGAWLAWRFTAPVQVSFTADIADLPFAVEVIPPVVMAKPGEVLRVVYRIRNNDVTPVSAFGRLTYAPSAAEQQMQVFITQCGGLNTYQNSLVDDYEVVFRVQPAGLFGASQIVVNHVFTRSSPK
jgi:cytochrome c oxidase assembly protein Cox11